eukprot:4247637-Amphidinium_carterae.1
MAEPSCTWICQGDPVCPPGLLLSGQGEVHPTPSVQGAEAPCTLLWGYPVAKAGAGVGGCR